MQKSDSMGDPLGHFGSVVAFLVGGRGKCLNGVRRSSLKF